MDKKYPEIVQFFRDSGEQQGKLQTAVNEYQKFAETFHRMKEALSFDHRSLPDEVFSALKEKHLSVLKHPRLGQVISQAKVEVAESIFFHSDSINREIYCYAETIVRERKQKDPAKKDETFDKGGSGLGSLLDPLRVQSMNILLVLFLIFLMLYLFWHRPASSSLLDQGLSRYLARGGGSHH